jgi:hypothetical protein
MRSRALAVGVTLLLGGCAGAGAGSSSGGTDQTEAVLDLVAEDDGPRAILSYGEATQEGQQGSSCWDSNGVVQCADVAGYSRPDSFLRIPRGTALSVIGDGDEASAHLGDVPKEGEVGHGGAWSEVVAEGASGGTVDAAPGLYLLTVFSYFDQGDSGFAFGIEIVEPAATL